MSVYISEKAAAECSRAKQNVDKLSKADELALAVLAKQPDGGDAVQKIIDAHMANIVQLCGKFTMKFGVRTDDYDEVFTLMLAKMVDIIKEKFDPNKGFGVMTYATWHLQNCVQDYAASFKNAIRKPRTKKSKQQEREGSNTLNVTHLLSESTGEPNGLTYGDQLTIGSPEMSLDAQLDFQELRRKHGKKIAKLEELIANPLNRAEKKEFDALAASVKEDELNARALTAMKNGEKTEYVPTNLKQRPRLTLDDVGVKKGDTLTFKANGFDLVDCMYAGKNMVFLPTGEKMSLTKATHVLRNKVSTIYWGKFWYKGVVGCMELLEDWYQDRGLCEPISQKRREGRLAHQVRQAKAEKERLRKAKAEEKKALRKQLKASNKETV